MKKRYADPSIIRKKSLTSNIQFFNGVPLPSVIEISESGTCNRSCSFCPRSAPNFPDIPEFISDALIEKISLEMADVNYSGLFLFSGFVEPLLDKKICNHINTIKKNNPYCRIELVTNGDPLRLPLIKKLFQSGLSTLLISAYDGPDEALALEGLCHRAGLEESQFVVRKRYLPKEQHFGITLSNRAGMMDKAEFNIPSVNEPLKDDCLYPGYTFFMDYLGDVLLCPHDWGKKYVTGNLMNSTFWEIWTSKKFDIARQKLMCGDRGISPCNKCDVVGNLMGVEHEKAWKALA